MTNLPSRSPMSELLSGRARRDFARARSYSASVAAFEMANVEAVAQVSEAAMAAAARISAVEALLVSRTPHAEARLRYVADAGCTSLANIVLRAGSCIR